MTKTLFTIGLALVPLLSAEAADRCHANIAGKTQHWAIAVCKMKVGTDDFENDQVQQCVSRLIKADKIDMNKPPSCMLNTKYKRALCRYLVEEAFEKSVSECMRSKENIPKIVTNDGA